VPSLLATPRSDMIALTLRCPPGRPAASRGAMTRTRHALTGAEYEAEGPNCVRVVDGAKWGRFDRYGGWLEGEVRQCDPQLGIWLTGLLVVQTRNHSAAKSQEGRNE
jgi:hypothetical protein